MENLENNTAQLFGLTIDSTGKQHLSEAARWARFIAIVGFVFLGLFVVAAIFAGTVMTSLINRSSGFEGETGMAMNGGFAFGIVLYYLVIGLLVFFAYLFLYRFATQMKKAIVGNDQDELNSSLMNLKVLFRYVGILTIVCLALGIIGFLFAIVTLTAMGTF